MASRSRCWSRACPSSTSWRLNPSSTRRGGNSERCSGAWRRTGRGARGNRRELVDKIKIALQENLEHCKIEATITGREKHLYSIYRKMQEKNLAFSEVVDIYGFRVVVRDEPSCYLALGALHSLYKPIPGKFQDSM